MPSAKFLSSSDTINGWALICPVERPEKSSAGGRFWKAKCPHCDETRVKSVAQFRQAHSCGCVKKTGIPLKVRNARWSIIKRCKDHPDYAGRGIRVCQEWMDSDESFYACVGDPPSPNHSIDRIDNNKGYEPGNVRWADDFDQANNKRNNRIIEIDGVKKTMAQWSRVSGVPTKRIQKRLDELGWSEKDAVFKEVIKDHHTRDKIIDFDGKKMNLDQWAKYLCVAGSGVVAKRLETMPIEVALDPNSVDRSKTGTHTLISYAGKSLTRNGWAKELGVGEKRLRHPISKGENPISVLHRLAQEVGYAGY